MKKLCCRSRLVPAALFVCRRNYRTGSGGGSGQPKPTVQPVNSPGGSKTPWSSYAVHKYTVSTDGDESYWVYQPTGWDGSGAAPTTAPLVVFNHGYEP
jgi:hypothetical protein